MSSPDLTDLAEIEELGDSSRTEEVVIYDQSQSDTTSILDLDYVRTEIDDIEKVIVGLSQRLSTLKMMLCVSIV